MSRREEKAAATRQLLLDATFECLVEVGYHGTSTVAVCERSSLARGTMLHHFTNKQALVLASLEDVLTRRVNDFTREIVSVDTKDAGALARYLWASLKGPTFMAWLELAVASRTDPVLEKQFREVMQRFGVLVTGLVENVLPAEALGQDDLKLAVSLGFSALNGLALDLLQVDPEEIEAKFELLVSWAARIQN